MMTGIVLDIGAGDGSFAYALAKQHPDKLVVALDPNHKAMQELSLKASKKLTKGGLTNLMYALGSIEDLPIELEGKVNQVFINLPWAGLLRKLLAADAEAWANLKRICQPGAPIDILLSVSEKDELKKFNANDFGLKLAKVDCMVADFGEVEPAALKNYPSSWAKKLAYGQGRRFHYLRVSNSGGQASASK